MEAVWEATDVKEEDGNEVKKTAIQRYILSIAQLLI